VASRFQNPDDDEVRRLLERVRRIAVVGLSPKPHRDSHRVAR
jgi:predicted CoA-binding protein